MSAAFWFCLGVLVGSIVEAILAMAVLS